MNFALPGKFVVPEIVTSQFLLHEGDVVADFGAGSGFFLKALTGAVGPSGKVYACEIQKPLVEKLGEYARLQGLSNVSTLWCDLEELGGIKMADTRLMPGYWLIRSFNYKTKQLPSKKCIVSSVPVAFFISLIGQNLLVGSAHNRVTWWLKRWQLI